MASSLAFVPEGRSYPVVFPSRQGSALLDRLAHMPKLAGITPASRLGVRPAPAMVSSGIGAIDTLTGGLPCGCLTEICGPVSSGRTSILLAALAASAQRQEVAALVDTTDGFDPQSAAATGVTFERLLWVRCGQSHPSQRYRDTEKERHFMDQLERALRVIDLLLQSGGFGLVAMDFSDVPFQAVRRIPLTSWFRFQRAVEHTPTVLLVITPAPCTQACAALLLQLRSSPKGISGQKCDREGPAHAQLFQGLQIEAELLRSRLERKPARAVTFDTRAVRAG